MLEISQIRTEYILMKCFVACVRNLVKENAYYNRLKFRKKKTEVLKQNMEKATTLYVSFD